MPQKTKKKSKKQTPIKKELSPYLIGGGISFLIIVFVVFMVLVGAPFLQYQTTHSDWAKKQHEQSKQETIEKEKKGLEAAVVTLSDARQKLMNASPLFASLSEISKVCDTSYTGANIYKSCYVGFNLSEKSGATYEKFDDMEDTTEKILKSEQNFMIPDYPRTTKTGLEDGAWDNTVYFKTKDYPDLKCEKKFVIRGESEGDGEKTFGYAISCGRDVTEYVYPSGDL